MAQQLAVSQKNDERQVQKDREKAKVLSTPLQQVKEAAPLVFSCLIGAVFWFLPTPQGMEIKGWHLLAIFAATLTGIVTKALPMGACALSALAVLTATGTLSLSQALSGFSHRVVWLVFLAFFVAKSFVKTGLGTRIAYFFVGVFGRNSLGLSYGMTMTDLLLAPAIPSNTARAGGILYPIIQSLALVFGSSPEKKTQRLIGGFLMTCAYHSNIITSAMFLTSMAANPLMAELAGEMGIEISWGLWALAASVPGMLGLLIIPWLVYVLYPPDIKKTPQAAAIAKGKLHEMGAMRREEWITSAIFFLMLLLWVFGSYLGIDSTTAALCGVTLLLILGVINWNDVKEEQLAWDTFFWFASLIMMASSLNHLGVIHWIAAQVQSYVEGMEWWFAYPLLVLGYFYSHYFFAGTTAHVSSMFAAFIAVGILVGIPPLVITLSLAFCSSLSACTTHYGTGPGPILYGSGYVDLATWWKLGGIIGLVHLVVWIGIGTAWWKWLGLW
ncbi:MAG: anion permease [Waddliaceae bacterium]